MVQIHTNANVLPDTRVKIVRRAYSLFSRRLVSSHCLLCTHSLVFSFHLYSPFPFTGETDTDDCAKVICENGGKCTDKLNAYKCECAEGFEGQNCKLCVFFVFRCLLCTHFLTLVFFHLYPSFYRRE